MLFKLSESGYKLKVYQHYNYYTTATPDNKIKNSETV